MSDAQPLALSVPLALRLAGGRQVQLDELVVPALLEPQLNLAALLQELRVGGEIGPGRPCYGGHLVVCPLAPGAHRLELAWRPPQELLAQLLVPFAAAGPERCLLERAAVVAERAHREQQRWDGMPYLLHPLEVAIELRRAQPMAEPAAAALLHDVVEDGHLGLDALDVAFGPRIARLVDLVTVKPRHGARGPEQDAAYFGELLTDADAAQLKCADMICNTRGLFLLAEDRLRRRLTGKYAPQVEGWLLPWARARGGGPCCDQLEAWLRSPLTLVDLHHQRAAHTVSR